MSGGDRVGFESRISLLASQVEALRKGFAEKEELIMKLRVELRENADKAARASVSNCRHVS